MPSRLGLARLPFTLMVPLTRPLPMFPRIKIGSIVLIFRLSFHWSNGGGMGSVSFTSVSMDGRLTVSTDEGIPMGMRSMSL